MPGMQTVPGTDIWPIRPGRAELIDRSTVGCLTGESAPSRQAGMARGNFFAMVISKVFNILILHRRFLFDHADRSGGAGLQYRNTDEAQDSPGSSQGLTA